MDRKDKEQEVWTRVVEVFKDRPHMWDKKNKHYFNKEMRQHTFRMMYEIFQELEVHIEISHFKKKFENMCTSFMREMKKVNASKRTGSGSEDVYKPSLWYYNLFTFIEGTSEPSRRGIDTLDSVEEVLPNFESVEADNPQPTLELNEPCTSQITKRSNSHTIEEERSRKRINLQKQQEKLIETAQQLLTSPVTDEWGVKGKSIGLQLKSLSKEQQFFAEKLISDVIYYGKLEKLSEQTSIILTYPVVEHHNRYVQYPLPIPTPHFQIQSPISMITPSPQYETQSPLPILSPQFQFHVPVPTPSPSYHTQSHVQIVSPQYETQSSTPKPPTTIQSPKPQ